MFDGISVTIGATFVTIRECLLKKEPQPIILSLYIFIVFVCHYYAHDQTESLNMSQRY